MPRPHRTLSDDNAILDNLISGRALPDHLARAKAGLAPLPKARYEGERLSDELKAKNAELAAKVAERMQEAPLIAICLNHACKCGAKWTSFGFYARRLQARVIGEGMATYTKKADPLPDETPTDTDWLDSPETACMACFAAPRSPAFKALSH